MTGQVREDEGSDNEDDEMPCVKVGESEGDCIWRGLWKISGQFVQ